MNFQSDSLSRRIDRMKSESLADPQHSAPEWKNREGEFPEMKKQWFLSLRQVVRRAGEQGRGHTHTHAIKSLSKKVLGRPDRSV